MIYARAVAWWSLIISASMSLSVTGFVNFQARRTPLVQAVIYARADIVVWILGLPYTVDVDAQDVVSQLSRYKKS